MRDGGERKVVDAVGMRGRRHDRDVKEVGEK